ncbi:MAG: competence/damage-inducible protein A [Actinomycetota bacterium]
MICEIINVGTELLLGQNFNTNARDIGILLAAAGIDCYRQTSVGDNLDRIVSAVKETLARADAVILTGGLGSTDDDLTRDAIAEATGRPLVLDPSLESMIREKLREFEPKASDKTIRQAYIPEGARPIKPTLGTAAGFILQVEGKIIAATPGVPAEMARMLESDIIPEMKKSAPGASPVILSRVLKIYGLREVETERIVHDLILEQTNPTVAPLIAKGAVTLRLTAKGNTRDEARVLISGVEAQVKELLGDAVFGADAEEMEDAVGALLKKRGLTIALAESITGGLAASRLINTPGSSTYVRGGIVAYANSVKTDLLGVAAQTILNHGAVSAQTAEEMASGVKKALGADIGVSSTGVAGPGGGSPDKPVGLAYFCLATADTLECEHKVFRGTRNEIRFKASQYLLNMLRLYLLGRSGRGDEIA